MVEMKKFRSVVLMAGLLLVMYAGSSALIRQFSDSIGDTYERSVRGEDLDRVDVDLYELEFDPSSFLDELLNSDYFEDALNDLLQNSDLNMDPEQFAESFGDDMEEILSSFSGDSFNTSMFDGLPPEAAAIIMGLPMFYMYDINSATNPINDIDSLLMKVSSYDYYNTSSFEWARSESLDYLSNLALQSDTNDRFVRIKYPTTLSEQVSQYFPYTGMEERILEYTLDSNPDPISSSLKEQMYLGGVNYQAEYDSSYSGETKNVSYEVLYDSTSYSGGIYDGEGALEPGAYTGSDGVVSSCLLGPDGSGSWDNYRSSHTNFDQVVTELETYEEYQNATTSYEIMEAILNYVGGNFTLNYNSQNTPDPGEDPLEHFCQYKESNKPYDFTSLIVALARISGIPARYSSGYKWNSEFESYLGAPYSDPAESGDIAYSYKIGHGHSWTEAFIPNASDDGVWMSFDNRYISDYTPPDLGGDDGTSYFNLKFDDGTGQTFYPDITGYERYDGIDPNLIHTRADVVFNGNPQNGVNVSIVDKTYDDKIIATNTTNSDGFTTFDLDLTDWVSGPHLLNFTMGLGGETYAGNVSIINVLGDVQIFTENAIEPSLVQSNGDTEINTTGYCWDPNMGEPVRNAYVKLTHQKQGNAFRSEFIPPSYDVSDNNGNFTVYADMLGLDQGTYDVFASFNGTFSLEDELAPILDDYPDLSSAFPNQFPGHAANGYTDEITDQVDYIDYNYIGSSYMINGSTYNDYSATGSAPLVLDRTKDYINFSATTWHADNWDSATIKVYDQSEQSPVTSFNTLNGFGSTQYYLGDKPIKNWTAGPHLLTMTWDECPNPASENYSRSIWVFVQAPIEVNLTSDYYYGGDNPANNYSINTGGGGDPFNISGYICDFDTKERLNHTRIHYTVEDQFGVTQDDYLNWSSSGLVETGHNNGDFIKYFKFVSTTPLSAAPVKTRVDFMGFWDGSGGIWDSWFAGWNSQWEGFYLGLRDVSQGDMELNDPTDSSFQAWVDNQPFLSSYDRLTVPIYDAAQKINISSTFKIGGVAQSGATVSLYELTDSSNILIDTTTTDSFGNASFLIEFGAENSTGPHKFLLDLEYTDTVTIEKADKCWIYFNRTKPDAPSFTDVQRTDWVNLTRGESSPIITVEGGFNDTAGRGLLYAQFNAWMKYDGITYGFNEYFTTHTYNYDSATGDFYIEFYPNIDAMLGNWSLIVGFEGWLNIPGSLNGSPSLTYQANGLVQNISSPIMLTVENQPTLTTSWEGDSGSENPEVVDGDDFIVGITQLNMSGTLTYDNGTAISGEDIIIKIYDADGFIDSSTQTTNGTGGYNWENYLVNDEIIYYTVEYAGNHSINTKSVSPITTYY